MRDGHVVMYHMSDERAGDGEIETGTQCGVGTVRVVGVPPINRPSSSLYVIWVSR